MTAILKQSETDFQNTWLVKNDRRTLGQIRRMTLDEGMCFTHSRIASNETFTSSHYEPDTVYNFVFILSGMFGISAGGLLKDCTMVEGYSYLFRTNNQHISKIIRKDVKSEAVILKISADKLDTILSDTCSSPADFTLDCGIPISPRSHMLCSRMLGCRYGGRTACAYLQSTAVELLMSDYLVYGGTSDIRRNAVYDLATYIDDNPAEEFSLAELSRMAGMSHTKLNRMFRDTLGFSVFDYIRISRIRMAEQHLRQSEMSITEIAHCSGFCSSSHLYSAFLKAKGISPKEFRTCIRRK